MLVRRGRKGPNDFKLGTFIGRFETDGAASIAAKGLNPRAVLVRFVVNRARAPMFSKTMTTRSGSVGAVQSES